MFEIFDSKESLGALPYISEDVLSKEHGENSAINERAIHDVLEKHSNRRNFHYFVNLKEKLKTSLTAIMLLIPMP